jgi:predicted nucleic acid-binding protein
MTAVLIDTNVLVYPYDRSEPAKAARARQVLDDLARRRRGRVSTQVLGEFFRAVTTRLRPPIHRFTGARVEGSRVHLT